MTLRARLALLFGLIVLAAIGLVYLAIAPRLGNSLRERKLVSLAQDAERAAQPLREQERLGTEDLSALVHEASARSSSRVVILDDAMIADQVTWRLRPGGDSAGRQTDDVAVSDSSVVATDALQQRDVVTRVAPTSDGQRAQAAVPLPSRDGLQAVAIFSTDLDDVDASVDLIRHQLTISGLAVVALALLGGYGVARALSQRVKRLERAARKVAAGDFSEPVIVDSEDELGQLAAAFADMQGQLARLDSARRQFIATASHELRTPIFSLGGFLELLEDEELDPETRADFMRQIGGQVERLRNLATDLLDLSRLEAGALELHPEPSDVGGLAQEVAAEFTPALASHCAPLSISLPHRPVELECDPDRVGQVIRILLANALSHTPSGTAIAVSVERAAGAVVVEVHDNGPGIRRETMPHIFEPFFSSDDVQGSGLGLAIARELAERMQGELAVVSRPGSTTFSLRLPA